MKTTLIEHNNELYLVSDEKFNQDIPKGTEYYDGEGKIRIWGTGNCFSTLSKNILASEKSTPIGLIIPSDLMEVFKGVDMAEIAYTNLLEKSEQDKNHVGYGKGLNGVEKSRWKSIYNQALQDNKEKRFTLEDMKTAIVKALQFGREIKDKDLKGFVYEILPYTDKYLQSLSTPKEWKVEIETWTNGNWESYCEERRQCVNCFETNLKSEPYNCKCGLKPKLTKNSEGKECYTITKIIH